MLVLHQFASASCGWLLGRLSLVSVFLFVITAINVAWNCALGVFLKGLERVINLDLATLDLIVHLLIFPFCFCDRVLGRQITVFDKAADDLVVVVGINQVRLGPSQALAPA